MELDGEVKVHCSALYCKHVNFISKVSFRSPLNKVTYANLNMYVANINFHVNFMKIEILNPDNLDVCKLYK